jgi:hypothetical protein
MQHRGTDGPTTPPIEPATIRKWLSRQGEERPHCGPGQWDVSVARGRRPKHSPKGISRGLYQLSPHCRRERPAREEITGANRGQGRLSPEMPVRSMGMGGDWLRQTAPAWVFSGRVRWQISPIAAAISCLSSGLLMAALAFLFSERPVSLRSSGLRRLGMVLEI